MKFVVEHMSKGGGRLGRLSGLRSQPDASHNTPLSLISTTGGSVPHLTQDVLHLVAEGTAPLCVPTQHFCEHVKVLQNFRKGVAHFAALQSHSVCVTVQDPAKATPSGYNDKQGVSTWTYGGRQILNADSYMQVVEAMRPDWYEVLSDADTPPAASKKRLSKSLAHSKTYITSCLQHHKESQALHGCGVLVPLLGGHSQADRARWIKGLSQLLEEDSLVSGYMLQGLHGNGPEVELLTPGQVTELARTSLESLPEGRVRQAGGGWSPAMVISLVELGVDVFDSSFPHLVTQRNGALTFPHSLHRGNESREAEGEEANLEHQDKKLKLCEEEEEEGEKQEKEQQKVETWKKEEQNETSATKKGENKKSLKKEENGMKLATSVYEICLLDKSYVLDEGPLLDGCECYTCKNFSRAYVHHLVNVNEMLAPVLLMVHNLHHWTCFFNSIREAVKTDSLQSLKALVSSLAEESDKG